jgi:hypothetical protein
MLTVLFFIIATCILSAVNGFSPSQTRHSSFIIKTHNYLVHLHHHTSPISHNTRLCSSPEDKQAEIEALEAKIRELKGEAAVESSEDLKGDNTQSEAQEEEEEQNGKY